MDYRNETVNYFGIFIIAIHGENIILGDISYEHGNLLFFRNWKFPSCCKGIKKEISRKPLQEEDIIILKSVQRTLPDKNIRMSRRICSLSLVHPYIRLLF